MVSGDVTPTQQRIVSYLAAKSPKWVSGYELRDECMPGRDLKNLHVHICHARHRGIRIESYKGSRGGYRIVAPDQMGRRILSNRMAERVLTHVSERTGVSIDRIHEYGGGSEATVARRRAARLFRRMGYGLPDIGLAMHRHHTTVLHHLGRRTR